MSSKNTIFYKKNQEYLLDFSSEEISTDASVYLAEKIERKHHLIRDISSYLKDDRDQNHITHSYEDLLNPDYALEY
jgi:hypothetical protein